MTKCDIKAFEITHLGFFHPKDEYVNLKADMERNIKNPNMTILTLFWGDEVLAILGVTKFREGVGELWLLPSIYVDSCPITFFKAVKNLIYGFVFPNLCFHRLEIAILSGWKKGMKWAQKLGFKISHMCKAYDVHRRDHIIYYKVV